LIVGQIKSSTIPRGILRKEKMARAYEAYLCGVVVVKALLKW